MKSLALGLSALLISLTPALAERLHHWHHRGHVVGTQARRGEAGFPITAEKDSIRINSVGEVISQPVPVIQKERNFNARARRDLSAPQTQPQLPPQTTPARP